MGTLTLMVATSALLLTAGSASAATFHANDGPTFDTAVASANTTPGADTILLDPVGTYFLDVPTDITDDVTIRKNDPTGSNPKVTMSGQAVVPTESDTFTVEPGVNATFDTITIQTASGGGFAVFHALGNLTLNHVLMTNNNGLGILADTGSTVTVNSSTIVTELGGALQQGDPADITLNDVTMANNSGGIGIGTGNIILNNTALGLNQTNCSGPFTAATSSFADDTSCDGGPYTLLHGAIGLNALTNNGGPVNSRTTTASSPLRAHGTNCGRLSDTRYFVYTSPASCDIGAVKSTAVVDVAAPTCAVSALRAGPPKQQDVTAQDVGVGLDPLSVSNPLISNGTIAFTPAASLNSVAPLVLTATKTNQALATQWSFDIRDFDGNSKHCQ